MRRALHTEWTKLRTVPGTGWLLLGIVLVTVALGVAATTAAHCAEVGCDQDPARISLTGVALGQAVVAVLAVLAVSGEYSSGMIRTTLAATPRRLTVLAAKAGVVGGLVLAAGTVAVSISFVVGRFLLPGKGFTVAHGYRVLSLTDGPVLRAVSGSVLYLVLIALLCVGIATAVRDAATAVGIVLALLFLFPIVASVVANPDWYRHLRQLGPMTAGLTVQATVDVADQPVRPWAGLGVLAAWSASALLAGGLLLRTRDA